MKKQKIIISKKKIGLVIGGIGFVASILGIIQFFLGDKLNEVNIGKNSNENTIIQGDNNQITKTEIINSSIKIQDLYPEIINDYKGVYIKKIIQDFGEPHTVMDAIGFSSQSYFSENELLYSYSFPSGTIGFYVNKENQLSNTIEISLSENSTQIIKIPSLVERGENHKDVLLGEVTFGDLFELANYSQDKIKRVESYQGGSLGNDYTEIDFYFGNFGGYQTFTFGIPGLFNEKINKDYKILSQEKPTMVLIQ